MKKIVLTLTTLLFSTLLSQAQTIPNGDFENWTSKTTNSISYMEPNGWLDYDSILLTGAQKSNITLISYTPSVTQVAGYGGGFAVQIADNVDEFTDSVETDKDTTLPGLIEMKFSLQGAMPTTFSGYYQFSEGTGITDTATILFALTQWNTTYNYTQNVGGGFLYFTSNTAGFTTFSMALHYDSAAAPDSAAILIASGNFYNPKPILDSGTYIIVDQLSLSGTYVTAVTSAQTTGAVAAYPNPATDVLNFTNLPASAAKVQISDVTGRQVVQTTLPGSIDVSGLTQGIYIYSITDNSGNTLSTSRFVK